jgi:hypothetical protein
MLASFDSPAYAAGRGVRRQCSENAELSRWLPDKRSAIYVVFGYSRPRLSHNVQQDPGQLVGKVGHHVSNAIVPHIAVEVKPL